MNDYISLLRPKHYLKNVLVLLPLLYGHAYAADHHKQHDHKNPQPWPVPRQLLSPFHMRSPKFRRNCIFLEIIVPLTDTNVKRREFSLFCRILKYNMVSYCSEYHARGNGL